MTAPQQDKFDEEGLSAFEPIRVYDMPGVALNQILSGTGSINSLVRTVSDSASLSPRERRSVSDRIKDSIGRNAVTDTLVDLATNPFVILLALTSPITARQVAKAGGRLITGLPNSGISKRVIEMARAGNMLGLTNAVANRAVPAVMQFINKNFSTLMNDEVGMVHAPGSKIMEHLEKKYKRKVDTLDWTKFEKGELQDELRQLSAVVHSHLEGRDMQDFVRKTGVSRPPMRVRTEQGGEHWDVGRTGTLRIKLDELIQLESKDVLKSDRTLQLRDPTRDLKNLHDAWMQARKQNKTYFDIIDPTTNRSRTFKVPEKLEVHEDMFVQGQGERTLTRSIKAEDGAVFLPSVDAVPQGVQPRQIIEARETQRQWHDRGTYEAWLKSKYDGAAWEYAQGMQKFYRKRGYQMYGVEDAQNEAFAVAGHRFHLDTTKVQKLFEKISKGKDAPEELAFIDPEIRTMVRSGRMTRQQFESHLDKVVNLNLTNRYVPRNDFVEMAESGARIDPYSDEGMASRAGRISDPRNRTSGSLLLKESPVSKYFDPEDLEALERAVGRSTGLEAEMGVSREYFGETRQPVFLTMNSAKKVGRYARDTAGNYSLYLAKLPDDLKDLFASEVKRLNKERAKKTPEGDRLAEVRGLYRESTEGKRTGYTEDIRRTTEPPVGGFNARDLLDAAIVREAPEVAEFMENYLIPRMTGSAGTSIKSMMSFRAMQSAKASAKWLIDSPMLNWAKGDANSFAGRLHESLRQFAEMPTSMTDARAVTGGLAGWLYKSHLGLNMMSIVGQMLQTPSFVIPTIGWDAWSYGAKQAMKQMNGYMKERATLPLNISTEERMALRRKHFRLTNVDGRDVLGITDDILDSIDGSVMKARMNASRRPGMMEWALLEAPLRIFENAEVFNRITTGEAAQWKLRQATMRAPIVGGKFQRDVPAIERRSNVVGGALSEADQIEQYVGLINYGATPLNTPFSMASSTNPLFGTINLAISSIRQFLTFPMRSAMFPVTTSPILGGGTREFGFQKFGGQKLFDVNASVGDMFRLMGVGAVIYEVGKNLTGSDVSQQLAGQAIGDLPGRLLEGRVKDLLPPILDIPVDAITGVLQFDDQKLGDAVARVLPAGVAIQRLSRMLPALPDIPGIEIQKDYADWGSMQNGNVPIYRSNGSLVGYQSAVGTLMKGIGADLGRFKDEQEVTSFLIKNRERMVQMKTEYKNAMMSNSISKAKAVEAQFQKTFGIPLRVQGSEWKNAQKLQEETLMARQLERISKAAQPQYRYVLEDYSSQLSQPPDLPEEQDTGE